MQLMASTSLKHSDLQLERLELEMTTSFEKLSAMLAFEVHKAIACSCHNLLRLLQRQATTLILQTILMDCRLA